jgi:hypothetical protein
VETDVEHNYQIFKTASKAVAPKFKFNTTYNLSSFPTVDQMKEHKEIWSNLKKLTESIDVYFGDKIGDEAAGLLKSLNAEPTHILDLYAAVNYVKTLNNTNAMTLDNIATFLKSYLSPVPHSTDLNRTLNGLIADMKCVIKKNIKIESDLSSVSCRQTPFGNNSEPAAITILPMPSQ